MISAAVLRQEIGALKIQNTTLNKALMDTIHLKDQFKQLALDNANLPNERFKSLQGFFEKIEEFLCESITIEHGKYSMSHEDVKKLFRMFPPEVM